MSGLPWPSLLAAFAFGAAAGAVYLWGLWLAVLHLARRPHGGIWLLAGAALRIAALLAAFLWFSHGHWERLIACALGFLAVRFVATRWAAFRRAPDTDPALRSRPPCA